MEPTRRNKVGLVASFYDPLGIISPVTVQLKIFAQELCGAKLSWDEQITGSLIVNWKNLVAGLQGTEPLRVPRCYFLGVDKSTALCTLEGFCDASSLAYGAVVYLRIETPIDTVVRFVTAKTRVAPLHNRTIPRLELLAALLLARLITAVSRALQPELPLQGTRCYSDSMVTLYWIKGEGHEWKQFIQNRVVTIRELVPVVSWNYCPESCNPADIPSRGTNLLELTESSVWLNGPAWLYSSTHHAYDDTTILDDCLPEMKMTRESVSMTTHSFMASECEQEGLIVRCEEFSTFSRLLRVTSLVMQFIETLKMKRVPSAQREDRCCIMKAEKYLIKVSQVALQQNKDFALWKLQFDLFVDEDGIWRCRGRLANAGLPTCTVFPILLDTKSHITHLIVMACHERIMHGGVKDTLTELRSKYWIVKGRSFVKKLLQRCVVCRRIHGNPFPSPRSPSLPGFRVQESPPFSYTGVDFAGPLYVKSGEGKVWICLYTCCSSRAVHLEVVSDLTAEAFIRCFRRFVARRGIPRRIISDNGTFKAATKTISKIVKDPVVHGFLTDRRVQWTFNLERAPWWGGLFERMVGVMKRCLKKSIGQAKVTLDELTTIIAEVEITLNSRPLTYLYAEELEEPLTPSHLLVGRRLYNLPDPSCGADKDPTYGEKASHATLTRRMKYLGTMLQHFWLRWRREYLTELREHHRYGRLGASTNHHDIVRVGDIVTVYDKNVPRAFWKLARVMQLIPSKDGIIRGALIRVGSSSKQILLRRPVEHLYPLEVHHESEVEVENQPVKDGIRPRRAAFQKARQRIQSWVKELEDETVD